MVLYLGLGAAVIIAIVVAFFVLRSARSRDSDSGAGMESEPGRRRGAREPDKDWSIDDYRSPHPIRGKYAAPAGARGPAGPGPGGPGLGGPGGGPMGPGGASRAPGGPAGRGYPSGYAPAGPGGPGVPGPGVPGPGVPVPGAASAGPGGYDPRATRVDWQPGLPPADDGGAYPDAEPVAGDGKKKGRGGKRFRLGHRGEEADIWPDDEVSDEDYWASVSSERSPLPSTEGRRGGQVPPAAGGRQGGGPRLPPMVTPVTARPQATPRPAAGLAMPSATPSGGMGQAPSGPATPPPGSPGAPPGMNGAPVAPGVPGAPGMNGGAGGPSGPNRQGPPQPGRYGPGGMDPRAGRGPRPEPNGYPDPRDLRPSARPPARPAPDRYQNEPTETFSMPDGAPTAQHPSRSGRHSRRPDDRGRAPYPYGQSESDDPGHRPR
jgi:hypothetical protein